MNNCSADWLIDGWIAERIPRELAIRDWLKKQS